ncbi:LysR family transcriptional regulator [Streptomyces sp. P9(2023)]|uniref:LysR family transcriptional regulator n=1 Tax=Streptomyces sp. P9(2023) TaxID=3064394 RepID=UPI0028F448D5|nr:LysR family transcriptional regulator [Streptomyces sp. P9(2023)]MDT9691514.1 LysR family transcriptional regulator [Streptomyces sp. P9(2023)]
MELRQLEYFVAVVEEANFTKAAARVFVTQPCVSAQVRRLERELGQDLLDRSGRTVQVTEAGAAALPHARAALAAIDGLRGAVEDLAGLVRGQVTLGSVPSSLSLRLPELIADFSEKYPAVEISLTEANTDQLTDAVRTGRVDVAIVGTSAELPADLETVVIADEPLIGAVGHEHPLAGTNAIKVEEIDDHALMCLPEGSGLRTAADAAWDSFGVKPRIAFEAGDPEVLAQLAARGLGVAILPERFVRSRPHELHPVEILGPRLRAGLALVRRSGGRISPAAGVLLSHARTMLA